MIRPLLLSLCTATLLVACANHEKPPAESGDSVRDSMPMAFVAPDTSTIPAGKAGDMIRYGRELIVNTPLYLGPKGSVGKYAGNLLACTSCHLDAGTRPYGLSLISSHARYPQYRMREARILSLGERVNNCIERPLNGRPIPMDSKEMNAILMYMKWLAKGIPVDGRVPGDDLMTMPLLDRAADPAKGKLVYDQHCVRCHGDDGQGILAAEGTTYTYPPLWGPNSYQPGSSMHRLIKAAQFIKYNMPQDLARWDKPVLTDEEAYDVAAYVNDDELHTRPPVPPEAPNYPIAKERPIDFYLGPFADPFSSKQHKFGPYKEIFAWRKQHGHPTGY